MSLGASAARTGSTVTPPPRIPGALVARNMLINLAGQALPVIIGVVSTPVVVHRLGTSRFGILTLAWTLIGYLSIFDLGLTRATTKFVASLLAGGETRRIPSIAWTTIILQAGLGILGGLTLAATSGLLVHRVLRIPAALAAEAQSSFLVLSLAIPVLLVFGSFRGLLEAAQRFDLVNLVRVPFNSLFFVLPLAGAVWGWTLGMILGAFVVVWTIGLVVMYRLSVRVHPGLRGRPRFRSDDVLPLLRFGGWVTVSSALSPLLVYVDRFVLGMLRTMAAVTYYAAPFDIVMRLLVIPSALVATLFPAFSAAEGVGESEHVDSLFARSIKYLLLIVGPAIAGVVVFAPAALSIWLGLDFAARSALPLRILAVGVLANSLAQLPYSLLHARGRPDLTAKFHLLEIPIHAVVIWWFVRWWGITGAAVAWSLRAWLDALLLFGAALRGAPAVRRALVRTRVPQLFAFLLLAGTLATLTIGSAAALPWRASAVATLILGAGWTTWRFLLGTDERAGLRRVLSRSSA